VPLLSAGKWRPEARANAWLRLPVVRMTALVRYPKETVTPERYCSNASHQLSLTVGSGRAFGLHPLAANG